MATLYEILKAKAGSDWTNMAPPSNSPLNFTSSKGNLSSVFSGATRTLPNGGGSFSSPVPEAGLKPVGNMFSAPQKSSAPVFSQNKSVVNPAVNNVPAGGSAPVDTFNYNANSTQQPAAPASNIPAEWIKPDGTQYTADEVVQNRVNKLKQARGNGAITNYAADAITNPNQTVEEMNRSAYGMNNARNDMATGATDPYKVGSKSGIAYSPTELKAIEKAYAGVYDPALSDVFSKLEAKKKEDELAATREYDLQKTKEDRKFDLEKLAMEHNYRLKEAATKASSGVSSNGTQYVPGSDPVVDGWVERLNRTGEKIETAIPGVKNQALRDRVMLGLNTLKFSNPATSARLQSVNSITQLLANPELENISGAMDQYTGGMWGDAKKAKDMFDQQVAKLELESSQLLKGQGAVSDNERRILEKASTYLKRGQTDEDFRKGLVQMRGAFTTASGLETPVRITDPSTGESQVQNLSTHEIDDFIRQGAVVEYSE
jgi:hypothetical protein